MAGFVKATLKGQLSPIFFVGIKEVLIFIFENLDEKTRSYMVAKIDQAEKTNNIYFSIRFNALGNQKWVSLLREAAQLYNEHWLAFKM